MDDNEIKKIRKTIFPQMKMAEERLESASIIIERETNVDAIPILFKAVDITLKALLNLKQKPPGDFQENIKSVEDNYKKEGLLDEATKKSFHSLYEMNKNYKSEIELEYDEDVVKSIFDKAENFMGNSYKFLKTQLTTPKERLMKKRAKKILLAGSILVGSFIIIFFLVKFGINIFGPKHGLLAHYYNNINLKSPAAVEKIDGNIDFLWGDASPHPRITGKFSARWEGRIKIEESGNYTFFIDSDEGVRLFLDDDMIIDTWLDKNRQVENSGDVYLTEGFHKMKCEYYFNRQHAHIKLLWSSESLKKRTVKSKVLYPPSELKALESQLLVSLFLYK